MSAANGMKGKAGVPPEGEGSFHIIGLDVLVDANLQVKTLNPKP